MIDVVGSIKPKAIALLAQNIPVSSVAERLGQPEVQIREWANDMSVQDAVNAQLEVITDRIDEVDGEPVTDQEQLNRNITRASLEILKIVRNNLGDKNILLKAKVASSVVRELASASPGRGLNVIEPDQELSDTMVTLFKTTMVD